MPNKKVFRRERMLNNPIPWIIVLLITGGIFFFFMYADILDWKSKKEDIKTLQEEIAEQKNIKTEVELRHQEVEAIWSQQSNEAIEIENQILPKTIDVKKITKVLEVLAGQLKTVGGFDESFSLDQLAFGQDAKDEKSVKFTLTITATQENLHTFITYLQTSKLPDTEEWNILRDTYAGSLSDFNILDENLIPLINIDSIRSTPTKDVQKQTGYQLYNVNISAVLYSQ